MRLVAAYEYKKLAPNVKARPEDGTAVVLSRLAPAPRPAEELHSVATLVD